MSCSSAGLPVQTIDAFSYLESFIPLNEADNNKYVCQVFSISVTCSRVQKQCVHFQIYCSLLMEFILFPGLLVILNKVICEGSLWHQGRWWQEVVVGRIFT